MSGTGRYFEPQPALWPIVGAGGLLVMACGATAWLNEEQVGRYLLSLGLAVLGYVLFSWFGALIAEGRSGLYSDQVEGSIRGGMGWFIFSEIVVFAALIAALAPSLPRPPGASECEGIADQGGLRRPRRGPGL